MTVLLLIIIYLAFISLGLPDSLLGSAWPIMHQDLSMPLSSAGGLSMIISGGTIISSVCSGTIIKRFGTGNVTVVSVLMTALALIGFAWFPSFAWLCVAAIPLGLGAGSVDVALNNFVAVHYKARHMSWLHCFWGLGATAGPMILSFFIARNGAWRSGYLTIAIVQFFLVLILLVSLPLWKKTETIAQEEQAEEQTRTKQNVFRIRGVKFALVTFFCYCAVEMTTGLWGSSYLVQQKAMSAELAAKGASLFFLGITIGRFAAGFATAKISSKALIRIGQLGCALGAVCLVLPLPSLFSLVGLGLLGCGCAPIFPSMLHETPARFGKESSQTIIGLEMAFAYMGTLLIPPGFGVMSSQIGLAIFPFFLMVFIAVMAMSSERIYRSK